MEKLVWQALVEYLESSFVMLDVDNLEGMKLPYIWGCRKYRESIFSYVLVPYLISLMFGALLLVTPFRNL